MHQILSQSVRFCRLYIKKHFGVCFFGSQCTLPKTRLPRTDFCRRQCGSYGSEFDVVSCCITWSSS